MPGTHLASPLYSAAFNKWQPWLCRFWSGSEHFREGHRPQWNSRPGRLCENDGSIHLDLVQLASVIRTIYSINSKLRTLYLYRWISLRRHAHTQMSHAHTNLSSSLPTYLFTYLPTYLPSLSTYLPTNLPIYPSIHLSSSILFMNLTNFIMRIYLTYFSYLIFLFYLI